MAKPEELSNMAISFIGFHDPFFASAVEGKDEEGPVLGLLRARTFNGIVLLSTPNTVERTNETAKTISERFPSTTVYIEHVELDDPTDYFQILVGLRAALAQIRERLSNVTFYIGTASGTPQMHACWLMLAASGELPARLLQTRPLRFVTADKPAVSEIDPTNVEFPTIRTNVWSRFSDESEANDLAEAITELDIVGNAPAFREVLEAASYLATSDVPVLLLGESGTGKEEIARLVHALSARSKHGRSHTLVTINCAAIPTELAESTLFGHRKGAFTGAAGDQAGRFKSANRGTVFLDEVGELPLEVQAKLLRVIQQGEIEPVGGNTEAVDVRIIAATNRDLESECQAGRFREDLYYRLNVGEIRLPPLRDRRSDIVSLAVFFLDRVNERNRQRQSFSPEALTALEDYNWPGNVRELQNIVHRSALAARGKTIQREHVKFSGDSVDKSLQHLPTPFRGFVIEDYVAHVRSELYRRAIEIGGSQAEAARLLGVSDNAVSKYVLKSKAGH